MMQYSNINWNTYSRRHLLSAFLQAAKLHQASVVFWSEPHSTQLFVLVNFSQAVTCQISEQLPAGFIFSPFLATQQSSFFLPAQLLYCCENGQFIEIKTLQQLQTQDFFSTLTNCLNQRLPTDYFVSNKINNHYADDKAHFITLVEKGLASINKGDLQKIVLARTKTVALPDTFDLLETFERVYATYPQHFVSLLSTPDYGTWLGCSPELLLSINELELHTHSLAGTKLNDEDWTTKEYQEQALVTEFIRQQLKKLNITDFCETVLSNLTIGKFKHLQTQFKIQLSSLQSRNHSAEQLLALLHPTPAVCGMPKQQALVFIQQHENFDRQLYCGYLGPCHIQSQRIQLYVNIRCMQVLKQQVILYAGAGITEASDPVKEWEETNLKCQTLLDFFSVHDKK